MCVCVCVCVGVGGCVCVCVWLKMGKKPVETESGVEGEYNIWRKHQRIKSKEATFQTET